MDDSGLSAASTPVRNLGHGGDWKTAPAVGPGGGIFSWEHTDERFVLGSNRDQRTADLRSPLPVLAGRLFFATSHSEPGPQGGVHFFSTERFIKYMPFCGDFGPFNLGMTHQFILQLRETLREPRNKDLKIVYYCSPDAASMTNAAYLLGAFMCVDLNMTPDQAWLPFSALTPAPFRPYRDATWAPSPFDLTVRDCWAGIIKARATGLYDPVSFDKDEYFYYDHPANGDMHEVVRGKFFAFKGPTGRRRALGFGRYSLIPSDYFDVWRSKNITTVVRLNTKEYDRNVVTQGGFKHIDLFFIDCSTPSDAIVDRFLRIAESEPGAIAIHCLAGLGRTGTLIALYMMKHWHFTAREAMGWLRICRPGSVIGPQQQYLIDTEKRMWGLGDKKVVGMGISGEPLPTPDPSSEGNDPSAARLAEMVTKGMQNRDTGRVAASGNVLPNSHGNVRHSPASLMGGGQRPGAAGGRPSPKVNPALRASQPNLSSNVASTPSPRTLSSSRKAPAVGVSGTPPQARDVWGGQAGGGLGGGVARGAAVRQSMPAATGGSRLNQRGVGRR